MSARPAATRRRLRVLYAASEAWPLIKTGGLADVAGALPGALRGAGVDARLLLPAYPQALQEASRVRPVARGALYGEHAELLRATLPDGTPVYLLRSARFDRPGDPYLDAAGVPWGDNARRFALLCRVGAALALGQLERAWRADVVHANDWQTGLLPALLSEARGRPATVFTVHNLAYRGEVAAHEVDALGLPAWWLHRHEALEFHGAPALIKGGLVYADRVTTVSPTYAREIQTPAHGAGLDGLLRHRAAALRGILNGMDTATWNPATDPHLAQPYDAARLDAKAANKAALQGELGLAVEPDTPLLAFVGRLAHQKGVDLLLAALEHARPGWQLAVLGSGEAALATALARLAARAPGRVAVRIGHDEPLAHRIQAGADILLVPSRYEPCGLVQLYAMRYGTVPVVHAVGGLADTVTDPRDAGPGRPATGFVFHEPSGAALRAAIERAVRARARPSAWQAMQRAGMARDGSWAAPARAYLALYRQLAP